MGKRPPPPPPPPVGDNPFVPLHETSTGLWVFYWLMVAVAVVGLVWWGFILWSE